MPLVYLFKPPLAPMLDEGGQEVLSGGAPKLRCLNIAGDIQSQVEGIASCEHGALEQLRAEGHFRHQTRLETEDEMYARYAGKQGVGEDIVRALVSGSFLAAPQIEQVVTGEIQVADQSQVEIITTPALDGIALSDFPENFSFGNGVTTGNAVKLRDGSSQVIGWMVFPDSAAATVRTKANRAALRAICQPPAGGAIPMREGLSGPTSIAEPSPRRTKECRHWFLKYPPVIGKARFCIKCGAARFGEHTVQLGANTITLGDAAADPASAGEIQRNGANLRFHDGSAVQDLAGAGALTREGGQTTEATTTSTSLVDLLTASSLTIAAAQAFNFQFNYRKVASTADGVFGLTLNSTGVNVPSAAGDQDGLAEFDGTNIVQDGIATVWFGARVGDYLRPAGGVMHCQKAGKVKLMTGVCIDADAPTVEITDVLIRGITASGGTMGADELHVYSLAAS